MMTKIRDLSWSDLVSLFARMTLKPGLWRQRVAQKASLVSLIEAFESERAPYFAPQVLAIRLEILDQVVAHNNKAYWAERGGACDDLFVRTAVLPLTTAAAIDAEL